MSATGPEPGPGPESAAGPGLGAGPESATPPWWALLPPASVRVPCGSGTHQLRWEQGRLIAADHPDAEAELVLAALGGDRTECTDLTETWADRSDDLEVLAVGPRSAADQLTIIGEEIEQLRPSDPGWTGSGGSRGLFSAGPSVLIYSDSGMTGSPVRSRTGSSLAAQAWRVVRGQYRAILLAAARGQHRYSAMAGSSQLFGATASSATMMRPGRAMMRPGDEELRRARARQFELLSLLALGPEFQLRLSATVAAAWAEGGSRAADRAAARPALVAALAGRLAPAAQTWLGLDPDQVEVTLHEGAGWGQLAMNGSGDDRRLRAALPVGWLASAWAAGLAVADGHLIVAVLAADWPLATVLGVREPGADPVILKVQAASDGWVRSPGGERAGDGPAGDAAGDESTGGEQHDRAP
jgi:hypothetical protein